MSEALPIGDFTFLAEDEVASLDLDATHEIRRLRLYSRGWLKVLQLSPRRKEIKDNERNAISLLLLPNQQSRDFWKTIFKPIR